MFHRVLADGVLLLHGAFVLFVALGGLLVLRAPRLAWVHLPAAAWGSLIEFAGWTCPLTTVEQRLRLLAGERGYEGGFIDHYVTLWLYPAGLTRSMQVALGAMVLVVNVAVYATLLRRSRRPSAP